jgi:hypothetical protein
VRPTYFFTPEDGLDRPTFYFIPHQPGPVLLFGGDARPGERGEGIQPEQARVVEQLLAPVAFLGQQAVSSR